MERPQFLKQGSLARLFPVLSVSSKEGRTTSIFLAVLMAVDEFAEELFASLGQKVGSRGKVYAWTEVVVANDPEPKRDRPDGLIVIRNGSRQWKALVETKIAKNELSVDQIERYRRLAKHTGCDCVLTISNQFALLPQVHPLHLELDKRNKIPVFHWSWMKILTVAETLSNTSAVADEDQRHLLMELRRFLGHDSAGVQGFIRMPRDWSEVVKTASVGGKISVTSDASKLVVGAWHQETKDLSLILTRQLDVNVEERLPRNAKTDPRERLKRDLKELSEQATLSASFEIPDAASALDVCADLKSRTIAIGMSLKAPEDRVSSKARLNWLLRQVKSEVTSDVYVRCKWPGRAEDTLLEISRAKAEPSCIDEERGHLVVSGFELVMLKKLGAKFGQQTGFIEAIEELVPTYYREFGQNLTAFQKRAPQAKHESIAIVDPVEEATEED